MIHNSPAYSRKKESPVFLVTIKRRKKKCSIFVFFLEYAGELRIIVLIEEEKSLT